MNLGYGKDWDPAVHYKSTAVAAEYDRQRFTSLPGRAYNRLEKAIIRRAFADIGSGAVICDVPCGTGRLSEALLEAGHRVVGVDVSPAMLEVARNKLARFGDRFETVTFDARRLQELGRQFDAALCARVLMHFPLAEQIEFLRSVASVCRGRVVFTQGVDNKYHRARRGLKRMLRNQPPAVHPLTAADFAQLLDGAGLRKIRHYHVLHGISEAVVVVTERCR